MRRRRCFVSATAPANFISFMALQMIRSKNDVQTGREDREKLGIVLKKMPCPPTSASSSSPLTLNITGIIYFNILSMSS